MKEVFTSGRFLVSLLALIAIAVWVSLGRLGAEAGAGYLFSLLTGIGVGARFPKKGRGGSGGGGGGSGNGAGCLLVLVLLLGGCAGWQSTANKVLDNAYATAKSIQTVGVAVVDAKCKELAYECRDAGDTECEPLVECQKDRRLFNTAVIGVMRACILGKIAAEGEDEDGAKEWVERAREGLEQITEMVEDVGRL